MYKVGTITAAILLIATAVSILLEVTGFDVLHYLIQGWPLLLIILGIEYLLTQNREEKGEGETRLKLAWGRLIGSVVVSLIALTLFQGYMFVTHSWGTWSIHGMMNSQEESFAQDPQTIALPTNIDELNVSNENGSTVFQAENRSDVEVVTVIRQPWLSDKKVEDYMKDVEVKLYAEDDTIMIKTQSESIRTWFINSKPRIDLTIKIPKDHPLDIAVWQKNGSVTASELTLKNTMEVETTNGKINVEDMEGQFILHSSNGVITAKNMKGSLDTRTTNGKMDVQGDFASLRVKTTNGSILVSSSKVRGDWNISTTNGKIQVTLPADGDYTFEGKTTNGSISSDEPLYLSGKSDTDKVGTGEHSIKATTTNGGIQVNTK